MKRVALWLTVWVGALGSLCAGGVWAQAQPPLPPQVQAALARAQVPSQALAVWVAPVQQPQTPRLAYRAHESMNPASLMKLVTTSAALDMLGLGWSWSTPVYLDAPVREGVLQGHVYIRGQGDPKLVVERLWLLLLRLRSLGLRQINGDIVLDQSAFEVQAADAASFDGEPLRPYNAAPAALLINYTSLALTFTPDSRAGVATVHMLPPLAGVQVPAHVPLSTQGGCGDWRSALKADFSDPARLRISGTYPASCGEKSWSVAYADPASYAQRAVQGMWQVVGGGLSGQVRQGKVPAGLAPAFEQGSPGLPEVIRDINKFSNNVMAQQLFLTLSLQEQGVGTLARSRQRVRSWWAARLGEADAPVLDNGSGLSRSERISAQALGRLLHSAWAAPWMPELLASLPVTGVDGTLRRSQAQAAGAAHLKTGSLRDVAGIAGVVDAASGQRYVLVAIVNHPNAAAARPALDALIDWTAQER